MTDRAHRVNWINTGFLIGFHAGALAAPFLFTWPALWVSLVLVWISGGWGIGMGYHRLLTHRGYHAPKWLEYVLTFCGTLALQGGPIFWVATHRIHHQNADLEGDPHSPRDGKMWAHMGWIVNSDAMGDGAAALLPYVPDLRRDRFHTVIDRWHFLPPAVLGIALGWWGYVHGGPFLAASFLSWAVCLRTTVALHCTWLVNSAAHRWGSRRFPTRDDSTNNWWVALMTFGEGWHNNHHADPKSARHGLAWYELDVNWICISLLRRVGVIRDVRVHKSSTSN